MCWVMMASTIDGRRRLSISSLLRPTLLLQLSGVASCHRPAKKYNVCIGRLRTLGASPARRRSFRSDIPLPRLLAAARFSSLRACADEPRSAGLLGNLWERLSMGQSLWNDIRLGPKATTPVSMRGEPTHGLATINRERPEAVLPYFEDVALEPASWPTAR